MPKESHQSSETQRTDNGWRWEMQWRLASALPRHCDCEDLGRWPLPAHYHLQQPSITQTDPPGGSTDRGRSLISTSLSLWRPRPVTTVSSLSHDLPLTSVTHQPTLKLWPTRGSTDQGRSLPYDCLPPSSATIKQQLTMSWQLVM